jgi:hypothetical protein
LGVCGWGKFALNASVSAPRIKAVAVSTLKALDLVVHRVAHSRYFGEDAYKALV